MELNHLRTFVVVAEERNVTRAARRLFMTPPAVSAHIKALEEELNIALFVRLPQGMQLTEKGALLRDKADQILRATQDMVNHATQMQDYLIGRLAVGVNAPPGMLRIAPLAGRMRAACPGIELSFLPSVSGAILAGLQSGALDAGFIFGEPPSDAVEAMPLATVALVVAAPRAWEDRLRGATWEDLARLPWIGSSIYCPFQEIVDGLYRARGMPYEKAAQADDEQTRCELVSAGLGVSLLAREEIAESGPPGRIVTWERDPIPCPLALAFLKTRRDDPLIAALRAQILAEWAVNDA